MIRKSNESVVDSRVVELTLDNSTFEKNATESISTISKLKKALDFHDAGRGLEDINKASKGLNLDTLNTGIETASKGFSAMEAVAFGALANIGAKISNVGTKLVDMFAVKPVRDGFSEYELKMGSIQTIMASTGESLDNVNKYLEDLNLYADKTIYSFSDMTASIGKFTNAGVKLDDAVAAIQGISNEAAVSGANAADASRAMYNFAQALSAGYVKLIDWKSIENANMATVEFKTQLLETAVEMGTVAKQADGTYKVLTHGSGSKGMKETISATKNFNDSLQQQWMTTDVLTTTLAKYADETTDIGKKAFAAATEVKTFSQLMDTLQEAAGSGWAQSFELVVGDFNEAKEFFTFLSNRLGGLIDGFSKSRNDFLKAAMGAPADYVTAEDWKNLDLSKSKAKSLAAALMELGKANGIEFAGDSVEDLVGSLSQGWLTADKLKEALNFGTVDTSGSVKSLDELHEAALKVIRGGETGYSADMALRYEQLAADGFDPQQVQDYVNTLHKLAGGTWNLTEEIMKEADATLQSTSALAGKSDEELRELGWSEKRIKNLRKLQKQAEETGTPLNELIATLENPPKSGRENLFDTIKNLFATVEKFGTMIKAAWKSIFPAADADKFREMTARISELSQSLKMFAVNNGMKIYKMFRGVFAILGLGVDIVKQVGSALLGILGPAIGFIVTKFIDIGAKVGDALFAFSNWVKETGIIAGTIGFIKSVIDGLINGITNLGKAFTSIPVVSNAITKVKDTFGKFGEQFNELVSNGGARLKAFIGRVKSMGGIKLDNIGKVFYDFRKRVLGFFLNSDLFKPIKTFKDNIIKQFENIKTSISGFFGKYDIFKPFKDMFGKLSENSIFKDSIKKVQDLFSNLFTSSPAELFKTFKDRIVNFFTNFNLGKLISDLFAKTESESGTEKTFDFGDKLAEIGTFITDAIKKVWEGFSNGLLVAWNMLGGTIGEVFRAIWDIIKNAWSAVTGTIQDALPKIRESFSKWFNNTGIFKFISSNKVIQNALAKIKTGFANAFKAIKDNTVGAKSILGGFMTRIKELGGFNFANLKQAFVDVKNRLGEIFSEKFKGFSGFTDAIANIKDKLKAWVEGMGVDFAGIKEKIAPIVKPFTSTFNKIISSAKEAKAKISDYIGKILSSPMIRINLQNFGNAFKDIWSSIKEYLGGFDGVFDSFGKKLEQFGGVSIKNVLRAFKETIGKQLGNFDFSSFKGIKTAFITLWGTIKEAITNTEIAERVGDFVNNVKSKLEEFKIPNIFQKLIDFFKPGGGKDVENGDGGLFGTILARIREFVGVVGEEVSKIDIPDIISKIFGFFIDAVSGAGKVAGNITEGGGSILDAISGFLVGIKDTLAEVDLVKLLWLYNWFNLFKGIADLGKGVKEIGKGFKAGNTTPIMEQLADLVKGIAILVGALAATTLLTDASDLNATLESLGGFLIQLGLVIAGVSFVVGKFGSSSGGSGVIAQITEFFGGLFEKGFIIGLVVAAGAAIKELMSIEGFAGEDAIKAAEAISLIAGVGVGLAEAISVFGKAGIDGAAAAKGMSAMATVFGVSGGLLAIIGGICDIVDEIFGGDMAEKLKQWIDKGGDLVREVAIKLGEVAGGFVGGIFSGFEVGKTASAGKIAENISDFVEKASALEGKSLNTTAIEQVLKSVESFSNLGVTIKWNNIISLGGDSIGEAENAISQVARMVQTWNDTFGDEAKPIKFDKTGFDGLVESVNLLPKEGFSGVIRRLLGGESTTAEFASDMEKLGHGIQEFSTSIDDSVLTTKVEAAVGFVKTLADAASVVGSDDVTMYYQPFVDLLSGDGQQMGLGPALNAFVESLTFKPADYETLESVAESAKNLAKFTGVITDVTVNGADFGNKQLITDFCDDIKAVVDAITYTASADYTAVDQFASAVDSLAGIGIGDLAESLESEIKPIYGNGLEKYNSPSKILAQDDKVAEASAKEKFKTFATGMVAALTDVFSSDDTKSTVQASVTTLVSSVTATLNAQVASFDATGRYLAEGFAGGMNGFHARLAVVASAMAIGKVALEALRRAIDSNSPSKEAFKIGGFFGEGFGGGINSYFGDIYDSSNGLGYAAVRGLRSSVRALNTMIEDGIDTNPVIRPVLDLSNIQNGTAALNGMIGINSPIGLYGNLNAINANVNARNMTTNTDILNALNELGTALNERPVQTNNYNVGGVTYDDGTNVAMAVRDLIHAARIERRV